MPVKTYAFEYDELSDKAKKKAREQVDGWESEDPFMSEMISEDFKYYLEERGLPTDVRWSLGYCQGDGVAFHGPVNVQKYMDFYSLREWGPMEDLVSVKINDTGSHYHHWNTMDVDFDRWDDHEECEHPAAWWISRHVDAFIDHIRSKIKEVSRELESRGYAEIEYRHTDEYLEETIRNNDWLFDEDGDYLPGATKKRREKAIKKIKAAAAPVMAANT